ncbi:MAG: XdhC family protein [Deltaproteobacteria bacterium]|nr:XdhC family protein [Deltaproteobacteria bacterium]
MGEISTKLPIPVGATPAEVLRRATEALSRCIDCCVATVIARSGSAPSTPGQKLILCSDGQAAGTVGGGGVERAVVERMLQILGQAEGGPTLLSYNLHKDLAMECGGTVDLLVEPMWSSTPVLVVGAGHVGFCVAQILPKLGFSVILIDERSSTLVPERVALLEGVRTRLGTPAQVAGDVPRRGAVVVATHEHARDVDAVVWAAMEGFAYVGGVGSRAKAVRVQDVLREKGVTFDVKMPIGIDIGARTPEEIAVSIAGELIRWRAQTPGAVRNR